MAQYHFVTTWRVRAPIDQVWQVIRDYQSWPSWWPAIAAARRVRQGDADGVGEVVDLVFRTPLGYRLRFRVTAEHVRAPHELDGRAVGELEGVGRWRLAESGGETVVRYAWDVRTTRWWMNVLAPIARPAFAWNHDRVMASGRAGLRRLLAGRAAPGAANGHG